MLIRYSSPLTSAVLSCALALATSGYAQTAKSPAAYPAHLPYTFSNLVWWSDEELRALLKQRIPGLGDEIATTSASEGRVRTALTALLKEKGIVANVQSEEPSTSAFGPPMTAMLGMGDMETPPYKPSILFSVMTPKIVLGRIDVQSEAEDVRGDIDQEIKRLEGKPFGVASLDFSRSRMERILERHGYLAEQIQVQPKPPYKKEDAYVVDWTIIVNAGPKYHISSVSVDGGPLFEGKDLGQLVRGKVGDVAGDPPFASIGPQLRAYYRQFGYADVRIMADPAVDKDHATVAYALKVIPGPVYHLQSLTIQKISPEQEQRVRELLGMKPGDLYREDLVNNLYRKIADEPSLKGYSFSFGPKADKEAAAVDLSLIFFKEGGDSSVPK